MTVIAKTNSLNTIDRIYGERSPNSENNTESLANDNQKMMHILQK